MYNPIKILAVETSVVDLNYPADEGNDTLKHAFISSLPALAKEVGFQGIENAPRKGDMIMVSAEALDDMLVAFAGKTLIGDDLPMYTASNVREYLFGKPVMHAGGSLANTFDSMVYSKIDGQALYEGNFVCSVGADEAGEYFKQSFDGHIIAAQGGRQMVSHIIPIDGDRIMLTSSSFADPSDKYFNPQIVAHNITEHTDVLMIGGYLMFAGHLKAVIDDAHSKISMGLDNDPHIAFTLAAQVIAENQNRHIFQGLGGDTTIHGNTGEFRRHMLMDGDWRERFAHNFVGRDGAPLQGRELESVKNANVDYISAKQSANDAASQEAYNDAHLIHGNLSYVVTNGGRPARVVTKDGISMLPNQSIAKDLVKSTVGAGDNHVAGYWVGKALGYDELGCLNMAGAFARAVIQIPEARLPRDARYVAKSGTVFEGPIAAIDPAVLDTI